MNCPDDDAISAYMDGELAAAEAEAIGAHLARCGECRKRHVGMTRVDGGLRQGLTSIVVPPMKAFPADLRRRTRLLSRPLAVAVAATALMAIAAGAAWMLLREGDSLETGVAREGQMTREAQPAMVTAAAQADGASAQSDARDRAADEAVQRELQRLAEAERLPRAADEMPAWKVEQLKRAYLYSQGIVPGRDG